MHRRLHLALTLSTLLLLILSACSKSTTPQATQLGSALGCTAAGILMSGNPAVAGSALALTNFTVNILDGAGGPYAIAIPNAGTETVSSTTYVYPETVTVTTSAANTISAQVTVTDASDSVSATCTIAINNSSTTTTSSGSSGGITITTSPVAMGSGAVAPGTWVSIQASAAGATSFNFSVSQPASSYCSSYAVSGTPICFQVVNATTAMLMSYVPATIFVTVTEVGSASTSTTFPIAFGQYGAVGGLTGGVNYSGFYVVPSPGYTQSVSSAQTPAWITLSGYSNTYSTVSVSYAAATPGLIMDASGAAGANAARFYATEPGTYYVQATASVNGQTVGSESIALFFVSPYTGTVTSLNCHIVPVGSGTYSTYEPVVYNVYSDTNDPLEVLSWTVGEAWTPGGAPVFPILPPLANIFQTGGGVTDTVTVTASSSVYPYTPCNNGQPFSTTVTIY